MKAWKQGTLMAIAAIFVVFVVFATCKGKNEPTGGSNKKNNVNALQTAIQNNNKEAVVEAARNMEPEAYVDAVNQGMPLWAFAETIKGITPEAIDLLVKNKATPVGNFTFDLNKAGNGIIITKYTGNGSYIIFPPEIEGYPVVEVNANSWSNNKYSLQFIVIPEGVKKIGINAFSEQPLVSIAFPSTLVEIGGSAISRTSLQHIDLSHTALTTIGYHAFSGDWNKSTETISVKLPDTVTKIENEAFSYNKKLTSINIPANIKTIEEVAFRGCGELINLTIPDSITKINWVNTGTSFSSYDAFRECGKLPIRTRQRLQELGYRWSF